MADHYLLYVALKHDGDGVVSNPPKFPFDCHWRGSIPYKPLDREIPNCTSQLVYGFETLLTKRQLKQISDILHDMGALEWTIRNVQEIKQAENEEKAISSLVEV